MSQRALGCGSWRREAILGDMQRTNVYWLVSQCRWLVIHLLVRTLRADNPHVLVSWRSCDPWKYIGHWFDLKEKTSVQTTMTHSIHFNKVYFYPPFPVLSHFRTRSPLLRATSLTSLSIPENTLFIHQPTITVTGRERFKSFRHQHFWIDMGLLP